ncbi:hypothetical protein FA13DRAFT_1618877 [Coprinellus micaceus]|uniref:Activator of Hsp90 ATPase AHSA1-like N-terminal domain-containing protein n=1 Tax=Coprinellus micaceus TaxID=71717 RepID=A0A4Y7U0M2_COPMI|nr:hypothetical protein FA13DRAFT_1618877 [Coprinellus micaceus]
MALPPSTANWHWKNKNVTPWAKEWITRELVGLAVTGDVDGQSVSISKVTSVEGDVELGQRKSKLLTIFDVDVRLQWVGTTSDAQEVKGSLQIPEVSHEIICDGLSDYVFNWSLDTSSSAEVDAVYKLARSALQKSIESKLSGLPAAIVDNHAKDIHISASGTATPVNEASSSSATPAAKAAASVAPAAVKSSAPKKSLNTSDVIVDGNFQASADDLFALLTDEKRIPAWTRNAAVSQAKPDTEYALFGGGVKGKYVSLTPGKEIVQTWSLQSPTWPSGHAATLTTTLNQGSDSTAVKFALEGVPKGLEDEIKRNLEGYYIHGFKSIGYVALSVSYPTSASSSTSSSHQKRSRHKSSKTSSSSQNSSSYMVPAAIVGVLVLAAAFSVPYFTSTPPVCP